MSKRRSGITRAAISACVLPISPPEQAVAMASQAADIASAYFDGDKELEKTS
jgi:hypothetical protein